MTYEMLFAGFGGQGIMLMGTLLAYAGMIEGKKVSWIPSYGPEMRGGTANCSVVVSDEDVGCPIVTEPSVLVVMNEPSLQKFYDTVARPGSVFVNTSMIDPHHPALARLVGKNGERKSQEEKGGERPVTSEDVSAMAGESVIAGEGVRVFKIDANRIAQDLGNGRVANMVMLGAIREVTNVVEMASLESALGKAISKRHHDLMEINLKALRTGAEWVKSHDVPRPGRI